MGVIFTYQAYNLELTRERLRVQQTITERVRENLEITILARSQQGNSALLQIENNGLVTAEVTRVIIKDPDTGESRIFPLTYRLTLLPNEKKIVTITIPNGDGDEKIGLITGRGKLYGALPAPRMMVIRSTTEEAQTNPQPSPQPSNPQITTPLSSPTTPSQPSNPSISQTTPEEQVYITLIPLRSNPYIEEIVKYITERTITYETTTIQEPTRYIWRIEIPGVEETTYTMTVRGEEWFNPTILSRTETTSTQTQTFDEKNPKPDFENWIRTQLRDLALQIYSKGFVESQEWLYNLRERQGLSRANLRIWWINWESHIVNGSLDEGTVTLRIPVEPFSSVTITFTRQAITTSKTSWIEETDNPKPPRVDIPGARIELQRTIPGRVEHRTELKIVDEKTETIRKQIQTGMLLLDNEGNAWNVFRDSRDQPILVRGSPEKTDEYTVKARDIKGNVVWLKPEDADLLIDVITGQTENPGVIGGELPGTPQFDENGNLKGFLVEK